MPRSSGVGSSARVRLSKRFDEAIERADELAKVGAWCGHCYGPTFRALCNRLEHERKEIASTGSALRLAAEHLESVEYMLDRFEKEMRYDLGLP